MKIELVTADRAGLAWAQKQVTLHHYLHKPVPDRCSVFGYLVQLSGEPVGCLLFGRPQATKCFKGKLTYGGATDIQAGKARFDRWEILNMARVWLDPRVQQGGVDYIYNLATQMIGQALRRLVVDYLLAFPPCFLEEPWRLRCCLSYCNTNTHAGTLYKAAGFELARVNKKGKQTWVRSLRGLQGHERKLIERASEISPRSNEYRAERAQLSLALD